MSYEGVLVIVPAKNEEDAIVTVVADARRELACDVLVVDDGSTDRTAPLAAAAGATVLSLPYNLGVGGAIRTGLKFAQRHGYEQIVQLDGDGQHEAVEAKRLLDELVSGNFDLVIGSRFANGYEVSAGRRAMMRTLSTLVSRRAGVRITDTTSGFRAMSRRAIEYFAQQYPSDYLSDTVEALLLGHEAGLRLVEVDVRMRPRQGGLPSASTTRSLYHLVRLALALVLHSLRRTPKTEAEK